MAYVSTTTDYVDLDGDYGTPAEPNVRDTRSPY